MISATRASKLLGKGCIAFLCAVEVLETPEFEPKDIPIVQEFLEVFQEVPGLPPDREIEFAIELLPGTTPISKDLSDGPSRVNRTEETVARIVG